jgi:hypothetical protein
MRKRRLILGISLCEKPTIEVEKYVQRCCARPLACFYLSIYLCNIIVVFVEKNPTFCLTITQI